MDTTFSTANLGLGPILHSALPEVPWDKPQTRRLPGIQPLDPNDWLRVDEAYGAQMALRERLADQKPDKIIAAQPGAQDAARELLDMVIADVDTKGFVVKPDHIIRPDGVRIACALDPMQLLNRLIAEDLCILQSSGAEHALTAASLAFPAGWTLSQKLGRPLLAIHQPVADYDDDIARRVQRLFDALRPGHPLVRLNALRKRTPELHLPRDEWNRTETVPDKPRPYIRSERQCLLKLPVTGAVVFSIHSRIVTHDALSPDQARALQEFPIGTGVH